ncbi:phenylalanine--tRNA ligase subunit beta [Patescibacteria group bacterium]|nr:phenylalanine--tRNA ligase subunit beta [Patescibacteria group bacterium]
MKVSRTWLQKYFDTELPSAEELGNALTFHAFEIEEIEGDMLDVKVLPDRACYALSHRGIAKEISAILSIPMKLDPLREAVPAVATTKNLVVTADPEYVRRHTGALVRGVKVGPSPEWLRTALEAVGQRSINNVVDISNYVMLDIGQPSGAFDLAKLKPENDVYKIDIRRATQGEKFLALTGETYELSDTMFVFSDAVGGLVMDVAGVKGGKESGVTEATTDIFLSVGNYDGTLIRRTAQKLHLFTDASSRYQNRPSPELTAYGMRDILALLAEVTGGTVEGVVDFYPSPVPMPTVSFSPEFVNKKLGTSFSAPDILGALTRLGLSHTKEGESVIVTPPYERGDISIPEDLVEEVGRIIGYDQVTPVPMPEIPAPPQLKYRGIERIRDLLVARGFTEISTPSFAVKGDILLSNPLQEDKPYLRPNFRVNMEEALTRAVNVAPRVLGPVSEVKLFELGTIFTKEGEKMALAVGSKIVTGKKRPLTIENIEEFSGMLSGSADEVLEVTLDDAALETFGAGYEPKKEGLGAFGQFSVYPFALRDVAVWTPEGTREETVAGIIREGSGSLLVRLDCFDSFAKEGRVSYAFRLVLEAADHTLTDVELGEVMGKVTKALQETLGYEVR